MLYCFGGSQTREQSEKEKRLEREIEKSKTDRQFMEREIDELKERCRRQERQVRTKKSFSDLSFNILINSIWQHYL